MEYTGLDLNKMIAELEGVHYMETRYEKDNFLAIVAENDFTGTPPEMIGKYDPLTDWSLLGPLMVKYKVEINYHAECCSIYDSLNMVAYTVTIEKSEIPRAIIICILKSKNII